jgi:hypothetical protein
MADHGAFYYAFNEHDGRLSSLLGAILRPEGSIPITGIEHDLHFYGGGSRLHSGTFRLTDGSGATRDYEIEDLGWVYCQGGGYFGGFNDGLGQGVYRGDLYSEGEVWDVSHPTQIVDDKGKTFELAYDWAENFVRLRSEQQSGLAHFECVVFPEPA